MAAYVTGHVDTVDIAGLAVQVSCRFPKPRFWARRHPGFLTTRSPDVRVWIDYDEGFWRGPRRVMADTVSDAPRVRRRGRELVASTGYYRAVVDVDSGRAAVRMAAGFDVAACMRTLAALWLFERETLLLRGRCLGSDAAATLACGMSSDAFGAAASSAGAEGWLAVSPGAPGGVAARLTPFLVQDGGGQGPRGWRVSTLWVPGAAERQRAIGAARALRSLIPWIWQADRRRAGVERMLDLAARVATAVRCCEVSAAPPTPVEAPHG
jgi:hypothetical protein